MTKVFPMPEWASKQVVRWDRNGMVEDICKLHGVGHPNREWLRSNENLNIKGNMIDPGYHGCCSCCKSNNILKVIEMGTNYYSYEKCYHCNNATELHIGKQSSQGSFLLHIIPEKNLNQWCDWIEYLKKEDVYILDECEEVINKEDFMSGVDSLSRIFITEDFS